MYLGLFLQTFIFRITSQGQLQLTPSLAMQYTKTRSVAKLSHNKLCREWFAINCTVMEHEDDKYSDMP